MIKASPTVVPMAKFPMDYWCRSPDHADVGVNYARGRCASLQGILLTPNVYVNLLTSK